MGAIDSAPDVARRAAVAGRERRRHLVVVAVAFILGAASVLAWQHWQRHGRDEDAFQAKVAEFIWDGTSSTADADWASANPEGVLAEGDRSCRWLTGQPRPGVQTPQDGQDIWEAQASGLAHLMAQYLSATQASPIAQVTEQSRGTVVAMAWRYLCPKTSKDHLPPLGRGD
jgi:hypothetical protein